MRTAIFKKDFAEGFAPLVLLSAGAIVNWELNVRSAHLYQPDDDTQALVLLTALFGGVLVGSASLGLERARGTLGYLLHRGVSITSVFRQKAAAALLWAWLLTISGPAFYFAKAIAEGERGLIDSDRILETLVLSLWAGPAVAVALWQSTLARTGINGWLRACLCVGAVGGTVVWFTAAREWWPIGSAAPVFAGMCLALTLGALALAQRGFERLASPPGARRPREAWLGAALLTFGMLPIFGLWIEMGREAVAPVNMLAGREEVVRDGQGRVGLFDAFGSEGRVRGLDGQVLATSSVARGPHSFFLPEGWENVDRRPPQGEPGPHPRHPYSRGPYTSNEVLFLEAYSPVHSTRGGEGWFRVDGEYLSWELVYVEPERRFYVVQRNYGSLVPQSYVETAVEAPAGWPARTRRVALGPAEGFGPGTQYFVTASESGILVGGDVFPDVIVVQPDPPALVRVRVQDFHAAVQPIELPNGEEFARVLDRSDPDWAALHDQRHSGQAPPLVVEARSGKRFGLDLNLPAGAPFVEVELPPAPPQRDELIWVDADPLAPVVRVPGRDRDLALGRTRAPNLRRLVAAHGGTLLHAPLSSLVSQFVAIEPGERKDFLWEAVLDWNTAKGRRTWLVALHWALYAWIAWLARRQAEPRMRVFWAAVIVAFGPIGLLLWGFNARWNKPAVADEAPPEPLIATRVSSEPRLANA